MKRAKDKYGFTLIEIILVLAIAGLIFAMVFIALPALQRQARDTQRREDMAALIAAIKKYQTNNRGALPTGSSAIGYNSSNKGKTTWGGLYADYLGENFKDPKGGYYYLYIGDCGNNSTSVGVECPITKAGGSLNVSNKTFEDNYPKVSVVRGAACDGERAIKTANERKMVVLYKLEGGGVYCEET